MAMHAARADARPENDRSDAGAAFVADAARAVGSSGRAVVQPALEVGPVDDPCEREADQVADAVIARLRAPVPAADGPAIARDPATRIARSAPSAAAGPAGGALDAGTESRIVGATGGGVALDGDTRSRFESAMGADLSGVRVHTDSTVAPSIGARAFTHGSDVHFAPGQFDPGSEGGQRLLAHELTHVVQQSGTARRLQAKLWDTTTFKEKTAIHSKFLGLGSDSSTAQDAILSMLKEYDKFLGKGFSSSNPAQASQAVGKILAMQDAAKRWLDSRGEMYADESNYNLATVSEARTRLNPDKSQEGGQEPPKRQNPRQDRMQGLKEFVILCDSEISLLSQSLTDDQLNDVQIDTSNKKYQKVVKRYPDVETASSVFAKIGEVAEAVVPTPGSSAELTIDASIPIQPGVSVTLGVGGKVERSTSDQVKLRLDVKVGVKGEIKGALELSAGLSGFLEAQAPTGAEAATLMSYALYRRGREGIAPTDLVSLMWGGMTGTAGLARSEKWSRDIEKQIWGDEAEDADDDDKAYVSSGGGIYGGAKAGKEDIGAEASLTGKAVTGRRIDKESIENRKGEVGGQNVKSDSWMNAGERQKRVGEDIHGWSFSGSAKVAGFEIGFEYKKTARSSGGGVKGGPKVTKWSELQVEVYGSGPMPGIGLFGSKIWEIAGFLERKARQAAEANNETLESKSGVTLFQGIGVVGFDSLMDGVGMPTGSSLKISLSSAGAGKWKVAVSAEKENKVPLPDFLEIKLARSQTLFEVSSVNGSTTTWVLGQ